MMTSKILHVELKQAYYSHFEYMTENVHVCFEVHIEKKLKTLTINESESFCLIFLYLGAYSDTKSFHQKRVLEIL